MVFFISPAIALTQRLKCAAEMRRKEIDKGCGYDEGRQKNAYLYCKFRDEQFALYDEYAKRHGMLMKTFLVVNALFYDAVYSGGGMTQAELCQRTFQSKQTVNLIIKKLLSQGYVTVEEAPENKRNKVVQMTEAGRERFGKVVRHITWAEDTAMSMFTPEEQKQLIDLSRTFTRNLAKLVHQETEENGYGAI